MCDVCALQVTSYHVKKKKEKPKKSKPIKWHIHLAGGLRLEMGGGGRKQADRLKQTYIEMSPNHYITFLNRVVIHESWSSLHGLQVIHSNDLEAFCICLLYPLSLLSITIS